MENKSIGLEHISTALKYAGISFIAGAVNHGFFSGARSFYTAFLGVIFFSLGTILELKKNNQTNLAKEFIVGAFFSIGLGFFTGGLQHFPDSPERSVWVVPFGFMISTIALMFLRQSFSKKSILYSIASSVVILLLCGIFFFVIKHTSFFNHHDHGGHSHGEESQSHEVQTTPINDHHVEEENYSKDGHPHKEGTLPHSH